MKNLKNSKFVFLGILIISMTIIFFFKYLSQNCCFWGDDFFFDRYRIIEGYFDCLNFNFISGHGCGYFGLFLCKFFSFGLPALLNIHPGDWICNQAAVIRGILSCLILLSVVKFAVNENKSKLIFIFLYIFTACYFFNYGMKSNIIIINYNFYRYFFSLLFYSFLWLYIYKKITAAEQYKINKQEIINIILICFCAYVTGTSIEIIFFSSALLAGLIIIYSIIFRKNKYNLNICFYLPVGLLYLAICLFTGSFGFKEVASERGLANINISYEIIKEFSNLYFKICFKEELLYWILFIILIVFAIKTALKNNEIKKIIFPILMQISTLTVMYSLVLCGRTYELDGKMMLYLYHTNIVFLYKMLILIPLYIYLDYIITNTKQERIIKFITVVILISGSIIYGADCKSLIKEFNAKLIEMKKEQYQYQKIMRFYHLKRQKAKIPEIFLKHYSELNRSEKFTNVEIKSQLMIYKYELAKKYKYEIIEGGLETFYKDGGTFNKNELENIKFSRLYDIAFVLNISH